MTRKSNKFKMIKVKDTTHELAKKLKRELSLLENSDLSMNDVLERVLTPREIQERLKIGSMERRKLK